LSSKITPTQNNKLSCFAHRCATRPDYSTDVATTQKNKIILYLHQPGDGHQVFLPELGENSYTCPVGIARQWLEASGLKSGPLFPS